MHEIPLYFGHEHSLDSLGRILIRDNFLQWLSELSEQQLVMSIGFVRDIRNPNVIKEAIMLSNPSNPSNQPNILAQFESAPKPPQNEEKIQEKSEDLDRNSINDLEV